MTGKRRWSLKAKLIGCCPWMKPCKSALELKGNNTSEPVTLSRSARECAAEMQSESQQSGARNDEQCDGINSALGFAAQFGLVQAPAFPFRRGPEPFACALRNRTCPLAL